MKQLIFTFLVTLCLATLPSAPTPHVSQAAGLDAAADVKIGAAQAPASIPVVITNGEVDHKITDAAVQNFNPNDFIKLHVGSEAQIAALKELIEKGLDINRQTRGEREGMALLHFTAWDDSDLPTTQFLITAGANLDLPDAEGFTPAHWAAHNGSKATLTALMEAGADLEVLKDSLWGKTALQKSLAKYRIYLSPGIIALIEVTTQDIEGERQRAALSAQMDPHDVNDRNHNQYLQTGLAYRAQYPERLAQQLALLQEAIPVPQLAQLVHRLVGRQIFSLEHVKALTAAQTT